jgi:hypothetical protein
MRDERVMLARSTSNSRFIAIEAQQDSIGARSIDERSRPQNAWRQTT